MKNEDTRIQFTRQKFQDALLDLLETKSVGQVTVTDLCKKAGLNRGTFYLHYGNPMDVLGEIEDAFLTRNLPNLKEFLAHRKFEGNYFHILMERLEEEKTLLLLLIGPNGSNSFQKKYCSAVHDMTMQEWGKFLPSYKTEHLEFLFRFSGTGFGEIILDYLRGDLAISEEELTKRMRIMGTYLVRSLDEF